ncbi:MAG: gamma-glutamylcyclotransferase family protein [Acidimicrobiia bacterium]
MTWVFVYGTLRSGATAEDLLAPGVVTREPAVLDGYALYGLTWLYPFVTVAERESVHGEAVGLDPVVASTTLLVLDEYEGQEYRRTTAPVRLSDRVVSAHLWVAKESTLLPEAERIASGDERSV